RKRSRRSAPEVDGAEPTAWRNGSRISGDLSAQRFHVAALRLGLVVGAPGCLVEGAVVTKKIAVGNVYIEQGAVLRAASPKPLDLRLRFPFWAGKPNLARSRHEIGERKKLDDMWKEGRFPRSWHASFLRFRMRGKA